MPPPSQRSDTEPPAEITYIAAQGFMTGAFRFGSVSLIAHMILMLPHPFIFSKPTTSTSPTTTKSSPQPRPSIFSGDYIRSRLFHRPLEGFSEWISPSSRVFRGLTPQFKVFIHMAIMTLGGCIWAEKRYMEYTALMRKMKRVERLETERLHGTRR
ncbi:hypothetical protein N7495_003033 [Penicillium taxi]|uniref:uncharacterized protein n=1 Tax=Penicillium taxi TaxID=168475 RepID=UPI002544FA27|nr:uncharacterized protein N7495_003033 [Penicillium taxi]KAJ5902505.1 hypothetical protein N7495_003033 [Penicillium taxi]